MYSTFLNRHLPKAHLGDDVDAKVGKGWGPERTFARLARIYLHLIIKVFHVSFMIAGCM